jgi:hypothetical protein
MTWKFIYTYRERCKAGPAHNRCWKWSQSTSKHTWMRFYNSLGPLANHPVLYLWLYFSIPLLFWIHLCQLMPTRWKAFSEVCSLTITSFPTPNALEYLEHLELHVPSSRDKRFCYSTELYGYGFVLSYALLSGDLYLQVFMHAQTHPELRHSYVPQGPTPSRISRKSELNIHRINYMCVYTGQFS